jgi:hypothetical protein
LASAHIVKIGRKTAALIQRIRSRDHALKIFRASLIAVLALSLLLHVMTLWRERGNIAAAHGDFIIYYIGSQIWLDGKAQNLYDLEVQKEYQARFNVPFRPDPLPYNHPAYELLLFLPLAFLPYEYAFIVWGMVNVLFLVAIVWLLSLLIDKENTMLGALVWLAFFPVTATLWHGQDSILSALLLSAVFVSLSRGRDSVAGMVLALGLYKPQLVLPIALLLAIRRRWAAVLPFIAVGALLVSTSIIITGWLGAVQYVRLLSWINKTHYTIDPAYMPNLRGIFEGLSNLGFSRGIIDLITVGTSIGVLCWSLLLWKSDGAVDDAMFDLRLAHLIVVTLLVSYHLYVHDLTLLAIPLTILLNHGTRSDRDAPIARNATLVALIIVSMPVVSLLLEYRLMPWMAIGLMLFAGTLSYELRQKVIRDEAVSIDHSPAPS